MTDILPSGDFRVVFAGPIRAVKSKRPLELDVQIRRGPVLARAHELQDAGTLRQRPDYARTSQGIFDLRATRQGLHPLKLVTVVERTVKGESLQHALEHLEGNASCFTARPSSVVVNLFDNGYGSVAFALDFNLAEGQTLAEVLAHTFAISARGNDLFRKHVYDLVNNIVSNILSDLPAGSTKLLDDKGADFLSVLYVLPSSWSVSSSDPINVDSRLRCIVQPERGEPLTNQSNMSDDL